MLHGLVFFEAQGKRTTPLGFLAAQGYARQQKDLAGGGSKEEEKKRKIERKAHIYCGRLR